MNERMLLVFKKEVEWKTTIGILKSRHGILGYHVPPPSPSNSGNPAISSLSILWLLPQFALIAAAEAFIYPVSWEPYFGVSPHHLKKLIPPNMNPFEFQEFQTTPPS